jgi:hypothetical protein
MYYTSLLISRDTKRLSKSMGHIPAKSRFNNIIQTFETIKLLEHNQNISYMFEISLQNTTNIMSTIYMKYPYLLINNEKVSGNYQQIVRSTVSDQTVTAFYQYKYTWTKTNLDSISWESHHKALVTISGRHYKTIQQFIHQWLQTNSSPSVHRLYSSSPCPYCCMLP